jgi:heat shock protein HslJ
VSESVEGRVLVPDTEIRLAFTQNALTAYAGCNHLSGPYRLEGNVLRVERLPMTMSACAAPRQAQDWWLQQLLLGSPRFQLDGWRLTLSTADRLILVDRKMTSAH